MGVRESPATVRLGWVEGCLALSGLVAHLLKDRELDRVLRGDLEHVYAIAPPE